MGYPHFSVDCHEFHDALNRPVLAEIHRERLAQDAKWGQQNHPDGTGPDVNIRLVATTMNDLAHVARDYCDRTHKAGDGEWWSILLEEVAEAFAESDPAALRRELIQVAAVASAWAEHIDRRAAAVLEA